DEEDQGFDFGKLDETVITQMQKHLSEQGWRVKDRAGTYSPMTMPPEVFRAQLEESFREGLARASPPPPREGEVRQEAADGWVKPANPAEEAAQRLAGTYQEPPHFDLEVAKDRGLDLIAESTWGLTRKLGETDVEL